VKPRVLFVCIHNAARSQMAEALLKHAAEDRFEVESAGLEPGELNPLAVQAMKELDIDISGNKTKSVFDLLSDGRTYDYVITVCDEAGARRCPHVPGGGKRIHWTFADPAVYANAGAEGLDPVRRIRDQIRRQIEEWLVNF